MLRRVASQPRHAVIWFNLTTHGGNVWNIFIRRALPEKEGERGYHHYYLLHWLGHELNIKKRRSRALSFSLALIKNETELPPESTAGNGYCSWKALQKCRSAESRGHLITPHPPIFPPILCQNRWKSPRAPARALRDAINCECRITIHFLPAWMRCEFFRTPNGSHSAVWGLAPLLRSRRNDKFVGKVFLLSVCYLELKFLVNLVALF